MIRRLAAAVWLVFTVLPALAGAAVFPADNFTQSIGVNIHSGWPGNSLPALLAALRYLRVQYVRDTINGAMAGDAEAKFAAFTKAGLRWDIIVGADPQRYRDWLVRHHDAICALEGPNEPDLEELRYAGLGGADAGAALQSELYRMAHGDVTLRTIPVLNVALAHLDKRPAPVGDYDLQNVHAYTTGGRPPAATLARRISETAQPDDRRPVIVSETGYPTISGDPGHNGVDEMTQAGFLLDALADDFAAGVRRTYLYDLRDDGADAAGIDKEKHYGLFHVDGSPKPSAVGLHNLLTLLRDDGPGAAGFAPAPLALHLSPPVANILLQKRNGDYELILWSEPELWTAGGYALRLGPARREITVGLTTGHFDAEVYDPLAGAAAQVTARNVSQVDVAVGDHPVVLQIIPRP